jgi:hypothetical protein
MPELTATEKIAPRSVLRHRPLGTAQAQSSITPVARRASRLRPAPNMQDDEDASDTTTGVQTGQPRRAHPLLYLGVGMLVMLAVGTGLSFVVPWAHTTLDDLRYGRPRTFQVDAFVGHNEQAGMPTHFIALNLHRQILIIELPGGDPAHARIYSGPVLYGAGGDLVPVTLSFADVNGDQKPDMVIHLYYQGWFGFSDSEQDVVFINDNGGFRPARPDELPAIERYLQQHGQ